MGKILFRMGSTYTEVSMFNSQSAEKCILSYLNNNAVYWDYNYQTKRSVCLGRFYVYHRPLSMVRIPRHMTHNLINEVKEKLVIPIEQETLPAIPATPIHAEMSSAFESREMQQKLVDAISEWKQPMQALPLQTGEGKTSIAINALVQFGVTTIIIVGDMLDYWKESILKFTDMDEDDIYQIQGVGSLVKLFKHEYCPKVFIVSLGTLRSYIERRSPQYETIPSYEQFLHKFGIGLKIIDEAHDQFLTICKIELNSNVSCNLYLSATFGRNDKRSDAIFNRVFPSSIKLPVPAYKKRVNIVFYGYTSSISNKRVMRAKGYSHIRYEAEMLKRDYRLQKYIDYVVLAVLGFHGCLDKTKNKRTLIYFSTHVMIEKVVTVLATKYPDLKIAPYIGSMTEDILNDLSVDIYLSTPNKCGKGRDIPGLTTVVSTIATEARFAIIQYLGRLRKNPNAELEYIDLYDRGQPKHIQYVKERHTVFTPLAKSISIQRLGCI